MSDDTKAPASQIHLELTQSARARWLLAKSSKIDPLRHAEMIAEHYVSNFSLARDILEMIRLTRHPEADRTTAAACVKHLLDGIKRNQLHDLGVPTWWTETEDTTP